MRGTRRPTIDRSTQNPFGALLRVLGQRPLTVHEASSRLEALGFDAAQVEEALDRGQTERLLDDARLAEDYLLLRAQRRLEGPQRLIRELVARGVDETDCRTIWQTLVERGDVDEATLMQRRLERLLARSGGHPSGQRRRVYNALLRAGFDPSAVREAVIKLDLPRDGTRR